MENAQSASVSVTSNQTLVNDGTKLVEANAKIVECRQNLVLQDKDPGLCGPLLVNEVSDVRFQSVVDLNQVINQISQSAQNIKQDITNDIENTSRLSRERGFDLKLLNLEDTTLQNDINNFANVVSQQSTQISQELETFVNTRQIFINISGTAKGVSFEATKNIVSNIMQDNSTVQEAQTTLDNTIRSMVESESTWTPFFGKVFQGSWQGWVWFSAIIVLVLIAIFVIIYFVAKSKSKKSPNSVVVVVAPHDRNGNKNNKEVKKSGRRSTV